ncbi:potassium voltage-gated channel subfamily B member 2-like [Hydra vulgaris]|uniref:potassium voltage-gated channel subfamily B member 2-like n=1 Tax=Hydra vulgaris TaxID=6087 RepID=UPI001F5E44A0|nr:potassium voltage-gated channel subfamily B member 2-like [Hydra vulgaris]
MAHVGFVENNSAVQKTSSTCISNLLTVNISGQRFQLIRNILYIHRSTRLGRLVTQPFVEDNLFDYYDELLDEYFFQRDPTCFPMILAYYTSGQLHLSCFLCLEFLQNEMLYWGIPFSLQGCCTNKRLIGLASIENKKNCTNDSDKVNEQSRSLESKVSSTQKEKIWNFLENEDSSTIAMVFSKLSLIMTIVFIITLCLSTFPELNTTLPNGKKEVSSKLKNFDAACFVWFTCEYIARFLSCPNKLLFIKSFLSAIDLLAITSTFTNLIVTASLGRNSLYNVAAARFIKALQILCIFRIFKLGRYFPGFQVLGHTILQCVSELVLFLMLVIVDMVFFSALVYHVEEHVQDTKFTSIVESFWWAIATISTVGYGDIYPRTTVGKLLGGMCCLSGMMFITLPIPIIANSFFNSYKHLIESRKQNKSK